MKNLLDTGVVAEYKKPEPNAKVIEWLASEIEESLFLRVLTVGEIEKGIAKMSASKRKQDLENFLEALLARFDRRILTLDTAILRRWGKAHRRFGKHRACFADYRFAPSGNRARTRFNNYHAPLISKAGAEHNGIKLSTIK